MAGLFCEAFQRVVALGQGGSGPERRRSLERLLEILETTCALVVPGGSASLDLWDPGNSVVLHMCTVLRNDPSERCRELATQLLLLLVSRGVPVPSGFVLVALRDRFGSGDPPPEASEEVRLLMMRLLGMLLDRANRPIGPDGQDPQAEALKSEFRFYINDLYLVLKAATSDRCPEVKAEGCDCIVKAAAALEAHFHLNAASLVDNVLPCLVHQHKQVRIGAVKAAGTIIANCGPEEMLKFVPALAQRLFDYAPKVRLEVSVIAGNLLKEWRYAEANCAFLLPLMLTSIKDDVPENQEIVKLLWYEVGQVWLTKEIERDLRIKDRVDYVEAQEKRMMSTNPQLVNRFNFGCRLFVTKVVSKLLPAIKNDLVDWQVETRIKASILSVVLLEHLEETSVVMQYADSLMELMLIGARDEEEEVVKNVLEMADFYGRYVPPKTWLHLICSRLMVCPDAADLMILSKVINASNPNVYQGCAEDLIITLQDDSVCLRIDDDYQDELLECLKSFVRVFKRDCELFLPHIFKMYVTIIGLASSDQRRAGVRSFLNDLAGVLAIEKSDIFKRELGGLLRVLKSECSGWDASSRRILVFSAALQEAGPVIGFFAASVVDIFLIVLAESGARKGTELQLKMFMLLSKQLYNMSESINSQNEFQFYALTIIKDIIMPALPWHAGRKGCVVRTSATSSLWSMFESGCLLPATLLSASFCPQLFGRMNGLIEDDFEQIRLYVANIFKRIFLQFKRALPPEYLVKMLSALSTRLDDLSDEVRVAVLEAFAECYHCVPEVQNCSPELKKELEGFMGSVMTHMDDPNKAIRNSSLECLKSACVINLEYIRVLADRAIKIHNHKDQCNALKKFLDTPKIS